MINSNELLPGDIIEIRDDDILSCDVVILTGQVVMNEAMLTGESIPVMKVPLAYNKLVYNP